MSRAVVQSVSEQKPLVIALSIIMLIVSGGTNFAFDAIKRDDPEMVKALASISRIVDRHDGEIRTIQIWQARTDADRYTSKEARVHADDQAKEFTKVYAEISILRRETLAEQRRTGEILAGTTAQLTALTQSIVELKEAVNGK